MKYIQLISLLLASASREPHFSVPTSSTDVRRMCGKLSRCCKPKLLHATIQPTLAGVGGFFFGCAVEAAGMLDNRCNVVVQLRAETERNDRIEPST